MIQFLGHPKFTAWDSNGDPLSGGLLYTYLPGTTTDKATYPTVADAVAATNANANPVVLDSRGEAAVVLVGSTKLVLKDSSGTTIWTQDAVNPETEQVDTNGNEIVKYTATSDAVNELTVANAATGNGPTISATGEDTNVDINITPKGSGVVTVTNLVAPGFSLATPLSVTASSSSAAEIRLPEDTDNGTNYMAIKSPAAITTTTTLTLPDGDGTANYVMKTNGSGTLSWDSVNNLFTTAASDTASGIIEVAVQSEMEAASSTTLAVTPGRQHYHPGVAKGWIVLNGTGTISIVDSYNVDSIVDGGTGTYTINWATDFSSGDYVVVGSGNGSTASIINLIVNPIAGSVNIQTYRTDTSVAVDCSYVSLVAFGDQ